VNSHLPAKLSTTVSKIQFISNTVNARLVSQYHAFMVENGASERHQNNNLKIIIAYASFLELVFKSLETRLFVVKKVS
jgi:hypothetical protein